MIIRFSKFNQIIKYPYLTNISVDSLNIYLCLITVITVFTVLLFILESYPFKIYLVHYQISECPRNMHTVFFLDFCVTLCVNKTMSWLLL